MPTRPARTPPAGGTRTPARRHGAVKIAPPPAVTLDGDVAGPSAGRASRPAAPQPPMPGPRTRPPAARRPSRSERGYRRLRALARLAVPERPVPVRPAVEPCAFRDGDRAPTARRPSAAGT